MSLSCKGTQNGVGQGRAFQEALRFLFRAEQCADPAFERLVTRAGAPEKCVALFERTLQDGLEEVIEPFPAIQVHRRFHQ
jgi:hypothetical protein